LITPTNSKCRSPTNTAGNQLISVNQEAKINAEMFHHNAAKLLYLFNRALAEIQKVVAFLTTRVKKPDGIALQNLHRNDVSK